MAPILALLAYGITGYFQPPVKQKEGDYQLRLIGDCKPTDNSCVLISGEFEIKLISSVKKNKIQLGMVANQAVANLSLALGDEDDVFTQFKMMQSDDKKYWQVYLNESQNLDQFTKFRLAAHVRESNYFIETGIQY